MKLLDRYILKHFIQNFFFGIFCFIIIFIAVDLIENIDKFIDKSLSIDIIVRYYIYYIPEILKLITPVGMLLASLFTISRFINYSELTAMQSAGIGLFRYLMPILAFGFLMTAFSIYFNGWVVPESNTLKFEIERNYLGKNRIVSTIQNLYIQEQKNRIVTIASYDEISKTASNVSIEIFDMDNLTKLDSRFDFSYMKWDSSKNDWRLYSGFERTFGDSSNEMGFEYFDSVYTGEIEGIKKISLSPGLIIKSQMKPEELNLSEHREFITNLENSGLETARTEVDYYSKLSFPFANIVTILFGVSISAGSRRRGGAALQFGISIIVSFIYLGFVKISQVFGYNGDMSPILTAWLANIIFLTISILGFYRTSRE